MESLKYLLILISIFNYGYLIQSDELLELNCLDEKQCQQFQHSGIKSKCIKEQCECSTSIGDSVKCRPVNSKVNNIIGGHCPCNPPNSECDPLQHVCYCVKDYMPSRDKRRCLPKMVALGKKCEENSQCQKVDVNAICYESKECKCMDNFVNSDGKCVSTIGIKSLSSNDTLCIEQYGNNTVYNIATQQCICVPGYFASIDNSRCLKISKYLENCTENLQCTGTMGPGGKCVENVCQCAEKYYAEEKKEADGSMKTFCTAFVERGQYCRNDEDCYQRQLNETEKQSMACMYGECNCKLGFYSYNDGNCIEGNATGIKSVMGLQPMIALLVFLKKYFS